MTISFAVPALAEQPAERPQKKSFAGAMAPAKRHSLLDAWKAQRTATAKAFPGLSAHATGGTFIVGRPSLVINSSNSVVYTRQYLGDENNCDVDPNDFSDWRPSASYFAGDHVTGFGNMMAMTSGTTGTVEPDCNLGFGSTEVDGGVTWICEETLWAATRNYTAGMIVRPTVNVGFLYQAQNSGTSGGTQPKWPSDPGGTIVDNTVTWKAIGSPPGSFRDCNPMEMAVRASGGGETVVVSEGDPIGDSQIFGWSEHIDMNSSGVVAFKAALAGYLSDNDEYGTGVIHAGPGPGTPTLAMSSGMTVGGRFLCGFSSMVAINDAGQIVADAYGTLGNVWQPNTAYGISTLMTPTTPNGRRYRAVNAGTSGSVEPVWPTGVLDTVVDGTITWQMFRATSCNDTDHSLVRYTPGTGVELLVAPSTPVAGANVTKLGCTSCDDSYYDQVDGRINSAGKVPVVVSLNDTTEGVYIFSGPGSFVEVARSQGSVNATTGRGPRADGVAPSATFYDFFDPRTTINDVDQVVFTGHTFGVETIYRYTPAATIDVVVSTLDDLGTRSGGAASGVTFTGFGNYIDLNDLGNVAFQANLSDGREGYFFWNGSTGLVTEIYTEPDNDRLGPEMITLNDSNVVAYVTGGQGYDIDAQEDPQTGGAFFWFNGTTTPIIQVGGVVGGDTVTGIYAQHHSFARRQLSSTSCFAVAYTVNGDNIDMDCSAGDPGCYTESPRLFTSCLNVLATPTLTTVASPGITIGGTVSDTATLSGGTNPTGTITFELYGPNDATCTGTPVFTSNVNVTGNGSYGSGSFSPASPGTYQWVASYGGDVNNSGASGACGDPNESVVVSAASPAISTAASPGVTVGGAISDSATLSGGFNPSGSITFNLYGPGDATCSGAPVFTANVPVAGNGNYNSGNYTTTAPGTYRWVASYTGDTNNNAASGACNDPNESVVVTAASPAIATTASSAVIGNTISDSATLSGGVNPTGTITFNLYGPADTTCAGAVVFTSTVPVAGNGTYNSGNFAPSAQGTYRWIASYSGDANNTAVSGACGDPNEASVVSAASPTIATTASPDVTLGGQISDTATLSGGFNPTGQITFVAYGPNDATCAGPAAFTSNVPVTGNGNYNSGPFTPATPGNYQWVATYSGDANNNSVAGVCGDPNETVTVNSPVLASPTITTTASGTVPIGGSISDAATLSGGSNATGSITFTAYGPNNATCSGAAAFTSVINVAGDGVYTSGSFTPAIAGTYRWVASYSGDVANNPASSPCNAPNEDVLVTQAAPALSTTASASVPVGGAITDTATLSGGFNPTGTMIFTVFGPNDATCTGAAVFTSNAAVNGNGNYTSAPYTAVAAGTYYFVVNYSGDANNAPANSPCGAPNESVLVTPAAPALTTTASPGVVLGGSVSDTANLSGGFNPTGAIVFRLYGPSDPSCTAAPVFTSNVPVSGNGSYNSASFTPSTAGTYRWVATYSGDGNNVGAANACGDPNETVVVTAPAGNTSPTLTTTASPSVVIGGSISDSATLSGGNAPTGTITFTAFGPNNANCTGSAVFTAAVPVNGNGTYNSGSFTPGAAGIYHFVAQYSGDGNNNPASSPCGSPGESVIVRNASPTMTTVASPTVALGGSIFDTATLSDGFHPTGTILFTVFGPDNPNCVGSSAFSSTTPVDGNGTYQSARFTPTAAGTYRFVARYRGDENNDPVLSPCNAPNESVLVVAAAPSLTTTASPSVAIGGGINATAALAGAFNPTGSLTFNVFGPSDTTCTAPPVFTSTVPVTGNGNYLSGSFTPLSIGTYRFVTTYSGDAQNGAVSTACNAPASTVEVVCGTPGVPIISLIGQVTTGRTYTLLWSQVAGATRYEVTEATDENFTDGVTQTVTGTSTTYTHTATQPQGYFYRVRAIGDCNGELGEFSRTIRTVIVPLPPPDSPAFSLNIPAGDTEPIRQPVFIPGVPGVEMQFTVEVDKPWLTVAPSSGILPPEGVTVFVTADPSELTEGTFTGTIIITVTDLPAAREGRRMRTDGTTIVSKTFTINLVTPVTEGSRTTPQSNSIIIPSAGHLEGADVRWQSDIRVSNPDRSRQSYQLIFSPSSGVIGDVKTTTISADAGQTIALDDIVRNWFGIGSLEDRTNGFLEIRPLQVTLPKAIASSRTYSINSTLGTLGQFIPAVPFTNFIGKATSPNALPSILSLQQIAQSAVFRTNLGLVEASGLPATALLSVFNTSGAKILDIPVDLRGGEQKQLNSILASRGVTLDDGRVEVQTTAGDGKVTAYASVIDNRSGMPLLVSGVPLDGLSSTKYVIPGVADLNTGLANWRTDMRVFNSGDALQKASVVFYPQGGNDPITREITINAGAIATLDNIVQTVFGQTNMGGAVHVVTPEGSSLIVTGRTYNLTSQGTFGQFIPAVTPQEAVGIQNGALHILQVEDSPRYRTNLGLAEVTGQPVTVEISVILPDTKITPTVTVTLAPNEFRQFRVIRDLGLGNTYNARIAVRAISGNGRVTAYGSLIDLQTESPTYVPAQQ